MPKEIEQALMRSFDRQKRKGKLKGVKKGQYVYGSKVMQKHMKDKDDSY